ncbi:MAG TPA: YdaS family helix-turn-helix protein [Candidatus Binataceae bacterium]|nr:YdaS family helix-turn-helix protein [Candidatus Binataceae bacterium]
MSKRKTSGRPTGKRAGANLVEAAVALAGGVTAVARRCGVTRQTVYDWIAEWRVERLVDALQLARASGIPVEKFAGRTVQNKKGRKM